MPNIKISELPATSSLTGTELLVVVQDGVTKKSVASALIGPTGPQGAPGASGATLYPAASAISGHVAIVLNSDGQCLPADPANPAHYAVAGITTQAAGAALDQVQVLTGGVLEHLGWTFTPDLPVFLGLAGALTQTLPVTAAFSKVLGVAVSPTRVSLDFQPAIFII